MKLDSSNHQNLVAASTSNVMLQHQNASANFIQQAHNIQVYNQPYSVISIEQLKQQQGKANNKPEVDPNCSKNIELNSDDTDDDSSDDENDGRSQHVYLSFDVSSQAASLLKKLALENAENLRDIGVLSVQLQNDPNVIKIPKRLKKDDQIVDEKPNVPLTSSNYLQTQQQPQKVPPQQPNPPTQGKKRNRKTINELTSSNYLNESPTQQFIQQQPNQQQSARNLQLEESLSNLSDKCYQKQHQNLEPTRIQHDIHENDQKPQIQHVKQFYQIDMNGNIQQPVSVGQFKPNLQQTQQQQIQPPQNFQNHNNINNSKKANYNYQLNTAQHQQQQQQHQANIQQYQMPSPMLANLLGNPNPEQQSPKLTNNNNNSPVLIRQLPNGNYDQQQQPSFQQQQKPDVYQQQQQQPDFNLMKSDDYKHIYQMRQLLASQADPAGAHQQQQPQQQPTELIQANNNPVNNNTNNKPNVLNGAAPAPVVEPQPKAAPKRKRAPADPTKSRTKKSKTAANSKTENQPNNEPKFPPELSIVYPNNSMSPGNHSNQQQQQHQFVNTSLNHQPETKLKTVNNLINEMRLDISQAPHQQQISAPNNLPTDNGINFINYVNPSPAQNNSNEHNSLNLVDKILNENLKKLNNDKQLQQQSEFKFDHNVQSMESFVNYTLTPQKSQSLNYVSLKLDNPMTSSLSSSSGSNDANLVNINQFNMIPKVIQRHNSNSNGLGASSTCLPSSSSSGMNNNDSTSLTSSSPLKQTEMLQQQQHIAN